MLSSSNAVIMIMVVMQHICVSMAAPVAGKDQQLSHGGAANAANHIPHVGNGADADAATTHMPLSRTHSSVWGDGDDSAASANPASLGRATADSMNDNSTLHLQRSAADTAFPPPPTHLEGVPTTATWTCFPCVLL